MGHGSARIARALGVREQAIGQIVRGDARTVSHGLRDAICGLYDIWWDKRAPARTRFEAAAATAARKRAIAGNWCAPAALDDDQLDTPGYRPRHGWKPAAGTGVAPDVRPSARPPPEEEPPMTAGPGSPPAWSTKSWTRWNATATTAATTPTPTALSA